MTPFTVKTLAERWACSEAHVRNLINGRQLRAFKLGGKLLRIAAEEVEAWEKRDTGSASTEEDGSSPGPRTENGNAIRSARLIDPLPKPVSQNSPASSESHGKVVRLQ